MKKYREAVSVGAGSVFRLTAIGTAWALTPLIIFYLVAVLANGKVPNIFLLVAAPLIGIALGIDAFLLVPFGWWLYGRWFPRALRLTVNQDGQPESLTPLSLFKLYSIGFAFGCAPFAVLASVLALFGASTVQVNGATQTGVPGLLYGLLMAPASGLVFGLSMLLLVPAGWWIHGRLFRRSLRVVFTNAA